MELNDLNRLLTCKNEETSAVVKSLQAKYNCSQEKVYWKFRAQFSQKLRDARWNFREPSTEEFSKQLLFCETKDELRAKYPEICNRQWTGIYDRVLGVSTFAKAREAALLTLSPSIYPAQTDNNLAMWAACRLGDGSFCKRRNAWRIEHCHWQKGWLERKVEMFTRGFPQVSTKISHNEKRNTYSWYSCKIGNKKFIGIGTKDKHEVVKELNPFGIWYLFLDDGCYYKGSQQSVSFAVENMEIATKLVEQIEKLGGPIFRVANKNQIVLTGVPNIIKFFKMFLEPFADLTPDCMKYKIEYKPIS